MKIHEDFQRFLHFLNIFLLCFSFIVLTRSLGDLRHHVGQMDLCHGGEHRSDVGLVRRLRHQLLSLLRRPHGSAEVFSHGLELGHVVQGLGLPPSVEKSLKISFQRL